VPTRPRSIPPAAKALRDPSYADNALFRGIPRELLEEARLRPEEVDLPQGEVVFREGDPPDYCYLIGSGAVSISKAGPGGREQRLALLEAGDFFGELALYDGTTRSATATTAAPTRLVRLDAESFDRLRRAAPLQLASILAGRTIERVRRTNELLVSGKAARTVADPAWECPGCGVIAAAAGRTCATCGVHLSPAAVPAVLAGKFRMLRRIGVGGMGVVYRAHDLRLDRAVAVKTLPRLRGREAALLRREARTMAAVSHPQLAQIYGVELWRGAPMLVVEYLPCGTLAECLQGGPLPVAAAIGAGELLARGLGRLHAAGFLHRDIKPSNVGLAADGTPKLLDFGVSHVLEAGPVGSTDGTLPYLSPEAMRGDAPDARWDLWALCVTLYEALAGRHPLEGAPPHWLKLRIASGDLPDIREISPGIPERVAAFFRRALAADPSLRPASARALEEQLSSLRVAEPGGEWWKRESPRRPREADGG